MGRQSLKELYDAALLPRAPIRLAAPGTRHQTGIAFHGPHALSRRRYPRRSSRMPPGGVRANDFRPPIRTRRVLPPFLDCFRRDYPKLPARIPLKPPVFGPAKATSSPAATWLHHVSAAKPVHCESIPPPRTIPRFPDVSAPGKNIPGRIFFPSGAHS